MSANTHIEKKRLENPPETIEIKIKRREKLGAEQYWEIFSVQYRRNLNVISVDLKFILIVAGSYPEEIGIIGTGFNNIQSHFRRFLIIDPDS